MTTTTENGQKPLVFIYFKVRGKMQPIRNLVCYLGLKSIEVHIEDKEEEKKKLSSQILQALQGIRIERSLLPLLVYEGHYIYDIYPIMAFICRRFQHEQLLGRNIRQKARMQQLIQLFLVKQPNSMTEMFKLSDLVANKPREQIWKIKKQFYEYFMNQSGYILEICDYLLMLGNNGSNYVLEQITLVDFMFLETCHYMLGMFNNLDEKVRCHLTQLIKYFSGECSSSISHVMHLQTMRNYVNHIQNQSFYSNNRSTLQSISIIGACVSFTADRIKGLRNIWVMNPKFVE